MSAAGDGLQCAHGPAAGSGSVLAPGQGGSAHLPTVEGGDGTLLSAQGPTGVSPYPRGSRIASRALHPEPSTEPQPSLAWSFTHSGPRSEGSFSHVSLPGWGLCTKVRKDPSAPIILPSYSAHPTVARRDVLQCPGRSLRCVPVELTALQQAVIQPHDLGAPQPLEAFGVLGHFRKGECISCEGQLGSRWAESAGLKQGLGGSPHTTPRWPPHLPLEAAGSGA